MWWWGFCADCSSACFQFSVFGALFGNRKDTQLRQAHFIRQWLSLWLLVDHLGDKETSSAEGFAFRAFLERGTRGSLGVTHLCG